jgi:hypothetical protein
MSTWSSQFVFTQSAATCALNAASYSSIGTVYLNEAQTNDLFNTHDVKLDTSSLAKYFPIFQKKLGQNKPLKGVFNFSDIKI